ncbi:hypothetical protein OA957_00380 [Prochlorococcus sp. AH-716-B04]|nr:hypothetical protein [Prochlorococcus sp. AH-716-B04]
MLELVANYSAYSSELLNTKEIIENCTDNSKNILKTTGINKVSQFNENLQLKHIYDLLLEKALSDNNIKPIGIIVCTQTPDEAMPALSSQIVFRNNLKEVIFCHDIISGCTGFVDICSVADLFLSKNQIEGHVLCFSGDINSRIVKKSDYALSCVFGDLVNLTIFSRFKNEKKSLFNESVSQNYSLSISRKLNAFMEMNGLEVMSFVGSSVIDNIYKYLEKFLEEYKDDQTMLVLHQANKFIVDFINKKVKNKYPNVKLGDFTMGDLGNSGSSSIPFSISCYKRDRLINNEVIICGYGVGMKTSIGNIKILKTASCDDLIL